MSVCSLRKAALLDYCSLIQSVSTCGVGQEFFTAHGQVLLKYSLFCKLNTLTKTWIAHELRMAQYALFCHHALEIISIRKSQRGLRTVHNAQLLKTFWGRQTAYVSMKTKSGGRLVKYDMTVRYQSPCVETRISIHSNRAATSLWYFGKQEIRCQQHLCLLVQVTETFNNWP